MITYNEFKCVNMQRIFSFAVASPADILASFVYSNPALKRLHISTDLQSVATAGRTCKRNIYVLLNTILNGEPWRINYFPSMLTQIVYFCSSHFVYSLTSLLFKSFVLYCLTSWLFEDRKFENIYRKITIRFYFY